MANQTQANTRPSFQSLTNRASDRNSGPIDLIGVSVKNMGLKLGLCLRRIRCQNTAEADQKLDNLVSYLQKDEEGGPFSSLDLASLRTDLEVYRGLGDGTHEHAPRASLIGIYRPTLLIYTSNERRLFDDPPLTPKVSGGAMDENCHHMKVWPGETVSSWYSNYDSSKRKSEYWYNLNFKSGGIHNLSDKEVSILNVLFDPGNGNGGGDEFP